MTCSSPTMLMHRALIVSLMTFVLTGWPSRAVAAMADDTMATAIQERADDFWFGHRGRPSEVTRTVTVVMQNSRFTPAAIDVKRGETVRFRITNHDPIAHEFVLGDSAEQAEHEKEMASMPGMPMDDPNGVTVAAGKAVVFIWTFTRAGELQYACHLPGHYDHGMFGTLNIHA
jgi:uncharacterized cupredoxin-like copper-binding protein